MTALVLKIVLVVIALLFVVVIVRSLFLRPNSSAKQIVRIRLHKAVGIVAAALIALGLFASVLGFGSGDMRDPVPFRIASVVLVVAGLLVATRSRSARSSAPSGSSAIATSSPSAAPYDSAGAPSS
jgi:Na+/H+ antiporter NhaD/arsenite permease-like protein